VTTFWSAWIIILTTATIVGTLWLLFANRKTHTSDDGLTTGHVYDGIEEFQNPLPAWWFYMFLATIVFGIGYLIAYPGLGNFPGLLNWSSSGQHEREVASAEQRYASTRAQYLERPIEDIAQDPALRRMGQRLYANHCAQCHGSDARGAYGFPNLTDDDWLWGGNVKAIHESIVKGRRAVMPGWHNELGDRGIQQVTHYVMSLDGRSVDTASAEAGKVLFAQYCSVCHQADGTGNPLLGAPNLTNGIWLYGGSEQEIAHTLRVGRNGMMPAFENTLSEDRIHILTAWVYGLRDRAR